MEIIFILNLNNAWSQTPRIVMTFEADEESGSVHIDHYLDKFNEKIGNVYIVICLGSGC